jgi:hypothetical protein
MYLRINFKIIISFPALKQKIEVLVQKLQDLQKSYNLLKQETDSSRKYGGEVQNIESPVSAPEVKKIKVRIPQKLVIDLHMKEPDGKMCEPIFEETYKSNKRLVTCETVQHISSSQDKDEAGDAKFTNELLEKLFGCKRLSYSTLRGSKTKKNTNTVLKKSKLDFIRRQLNIRAHAYGLNAEHRTKRSSESMFRLYVRTKTKLEWCKVNNKRKRMMKKGEKPGIESSSSSSSEYEGSDDSSEEDESSSDTSENNAGSHVGDSDIESGD